MKKMFVRTLISALLIFLFLSTSYSATVYNTIQLRRGSSTAWTASNPILAQGEPGYETDTGRLKIGDGLTHWASLAYYPTTYSEEWIQQNATFTYVSATKFSTVGNVTESYPVGIRVKAIVTAGTIYGTVTDSSASGLPTITTVTVSWDSGSLDSGLSAISIGIFSPVNSSVPPQFFVATGIVVPYGGSTAPIGWLMCYGQAVSRTTYANLFAVIGTTFGAGNGSTTFNVPDLRGRAAIGPDNMGGGAAGRVAAATSAGYTAGAETIDVAHTHTTVDHVLSINEIPSHSHTTTFWPQQGADEMWGGQYGTGAKTSSSSYAASTSYVGGGAAHNHGATESSLSATQAIMNPYVAINYIIRY